MRKGKETKDVIGRRGISDGFIKEGNDEGLAKVFNLKEVNITPLWIEAALRAGGE